MSTDPLVRVGAAGWQYPAWQGAFYPEGLPEDWMLSYYNTQYSAVYLPAAVWQAVSAETWAQWLYDTREAFQFVLEPGGAAVSPPAIPRVQVATPDWTATHLWWLDEAPDLRTLSQRIAQQAVGGEPLYVISRNGNLGLMEQANTLRQVMGY